MTFGGARFSLVPPARLRQHEHIDENTVAKLAEQMRSDGFIARPIVADEGTGVILDGHHRFNALLHLGADLVPVHFVDYNDPRIRVTRWDDGRPMDKREVVTAGMAGVLLPRKTSRHVTLSRLPARPTPLSELHVEVGS